MNNIFNFSAKRTKFEAFIFYIIILIISMFAISVACFLSAIVNGVQEYEAGYQLGLKYGRILSFVLCLLWSLILIFSKKIHKENYAWFSCLFSLLCNLIGGIFFGLIPVALLSTAEKRKAE